MINHPLVRKQVARYVKGRLAKVSTAGLMRAGALPVAAVASGVEYGRKYFSKKVLPELKVAAQARKARARKVLQGHKPKAPPKGKVNKLVKRVNKISKLVNNDMTTHIKRERFTYRALAVVNQQSIHAFDGNTVSLIEGAIDAVNFFDSATPTSLVSTNLASGSFVHGTLINNSSRLTIRNNYQVPCKISLFRVSPKITTNTSITSFWTSGLADQGNPTTTIPLCYLTDSDQVKDWWKIDYSEKFEMYPSQEKVFRHATSQFTYDPSQVDSVGGAYQKAYQCYQWVFLISGVLGHDTAADEQGYLAAGVDVALDITYKALYDGGINATFYELVNNSDAFTNGGVISEKPIADNIAYSVS